MPHAPIDLIQLYPLHDTKNTLIFEITCRHIGPHVLVDWNLPRCLDVLDLTQRQSKGLLCSIDIPNITKLQIRFYRVSCDDRLVPTLFAEEGIFFHSPAAFHDSFSTDNVC
ncbi:hypothetical protein CHS0354_027559 [Potamilus streckersoni]|uniref:Uncharacterized protein n=1 Tax=Potamilus streckersoni TaxID=2493646 RepID=A0AAE0S0S7_9BIVA|nr:hypothetical protein CHS0354_027559 [Potamilus streckersoni]